MSCFIQEIGLHLLLHMMHCGAAVCMKNIWGACSGCVKVGCRKEAREAICLVVDA